MRDIVVAAALLAGMTLPAFGQTRIDSINTNFRWLGPDDKIVVDRYDDPKVPNVSSEPTDRRSGSNSVSAVRVLPLVRAESAKSRTTLPHRETPWCAMSPGSNSLAA